MPAERATRLLADDGEDRLMNAFQNGRWAAKFLFGCD
jgi:hypothetical protein